MSKPAVLWGHAPCTHLAYGVSLRASSPGDPVQGVRLAESLELLLRLSQGIRRLSPRLVRLSEVLLRLLEIASQPVEFALDLGDARRELIQTTLRRLRIALGSLHLPLGALLTLLGVPTRLLGSAPLAPRGNLIGHGRRLRGRRRRWTPADHRGEIERRGGLQVVHQASGCHSGRRIRIEERKQFL